MSYREGRFWQPDVTVATVVVDGGRLLMVEESVGGRLVLNQPAGHLEPDESLLEAALRETREETGWDVRLTAFVGAYQWKAPVNGDGSGGRHYLRFAFAAEPVSARSGAPARRRHRARAVDDAQRAAGSPGAPPQPAGVACGSRLPGGTPAPAGAGPAPGMSKAVS